MNRQGFFFVSVHVSLILRFRAGAFIILFCISLTPLNGVMADVYHVERITLLLLLFFASSDVEKATNGCMLFLLKVNL